MSQLLGGVLALSTTLLACAATASPQRRAGRPRTPAAGPRRASAPAPATALPAPAAQAPGCRAERPAARGVTEGSLTVDGLERSFLLSVPAAYDPAAGPLPLVFAYHGLTGTPASLRGYLRVEGESAGAAIFVYPAGVRAPSARHPQGSTRWDLRADGRDVALFDALLAHLAGAYCVDLDRVFVVGHSAGAVMTNALGCARGAAIRAIAPIAGMWAGRRCADAPAVLVVHGRADDQVAFRHGEDTRDRWRAAAACAAEPAPREGSPCVRYPGCAGRAAVAFCTHEGNHGVPPPMAHEVWRFFAGYLRP